MTKPLSPLFMPAPRPASRLSHEDAQKLLENTADLGFGRPSTDAAPAPQIDKRPAQGLPDHATSEPVKKPLAKPQKVTSKLPKVKPAVAAEAAGETTPVQTLRLDVPESVWRALKLESLDRKVTVKYLILEALLKAGYPVDLAAIPEDGRRLR